MGSLTVRSLETIIVDLPLRRLQRFAAVGATTQSIVLLRAVTSEGWEGIAEAVTPSGPWWSGESVESIKLMIDRYIAPLVIGADPFALAALRAEIDRAVHGNNFAKATVEMALLDIQGKAVSRPLHELLGGKRRTGLPCAWPLATGDAGAEIDEAEAMIASGRHNRFKLKMGALQPTVDVARACTIARALDGRASVRVDPNERWDESTVKWAVPRMEEAGIALIEQPMPRWNLDASARLTARAQMPVMIDESLASAQDMLRIVQLHAADVVALKIMKSGGILATKRIADMAEAGGVALYMGTFLEGSIGTAANMQLAATLGDLPFDGELSGPSLIADDIAAEPAQYRNFELQLPQGNGIAAAVDEDKLKAYRRDKSYTTHAVSPGGAKQ